MCGEMNKLDVRFCEHCGARLDAPTTDAQPVAQVIVPALTCTKCGAIVLPGETNCDNCGYAIAPAFVSNNQTSAELHVVVQQVVREAVPLVLPRVQAGHLHGLLRRPDEAISRLRASACVGSCAVAAGGSASLRLSVPVLLAPRTTSRCRSSAAWRAAGPWPSSTRC